LRGLGQRPKVLTFIFYNQNTSIYAVLWYYIPKYNTKQYFFPKKEWIKLYKLAKRVAVAIVLALVLSVFAGMTVAAQAAITSFTMDRTSIQPGQTITVVVQTNTATTHVFADVGTVRTMGTQVSEVGGVRTWNILLQNIPASATEVRVFANTANNVNNAVSITIPISVGQGQAQLPPPGGNVQVSGPLAIVSITEIAALGPNQVRLEIVTGPGANNVWVRTNTTQGIRYPQATLTGSDANTRTWHVNLSALSPINQTVQVSANTSFDWPGANSQQYLLRHTAPFVPVANPIILNAVPGNTQVGPGRPSTLTITTNTDVNYVWVMVGNTRVNAVRANVFNPLMHTWTVNVAPTTTGNVIVHAAATNAAVGAVTHPVHLTVVNTLATINTAQVIWETEPTNTSGSNGRIRIRVYTNPYVRSVGVDVPGAGWFNFTNATPLGMAQIRWELEVGGLDFAWRNVHASQQIRIVASDHTAMGIWGGEATEIFVNGVGGHWWQGQTPHAQGTAWNVMTNPFQVSRSVPVIDTIEFTTQDDIVEVRVVSVTAGGATIVPQTLSNFNPGTTAGTRVWTLRNIWIMNIDDVQAITLNVQVRRATGGWVNGPSHTIQIHG